MCPLLSFPLPSLPLPPTPPHTPSFPSAPTTGFCYLPVASTLCNVPRHATACTHPLMDLGVVQPPTTSLTQAPQRLLLLPCAGSPTAPTTSLRRLPNGSFCFPDGQYPADIDWRGSNNQVGGWVGRLVGRSVGEWVSGWVGGSASLPPLLSSPLPRITDTRAAIN